jgi:acetylornithine/succinyldiaminopimelate/putrescine aminotransferase
MLATKLNKLASDYPDQIKERRGDGFLCGLQLADDIAVGDMTAALQEKHLLAVPAGENVLRLLPPLNITDAEIEHAYMILDSVFSAFAAA